MGNVLNYELGNICNLRCIFCYNDFKREKPVHFKDLDIIRKEFGTLKDENTSGIILIGGEPLFHPNIRQILDLAYEFGFTDIGIATNGVRFDDYEFAEDILLNTKLNNIIFSIHSSKIEVEDIQTRRKGILVKKMNGIKNVISISNKFNLNLKLSINHVLTRYNIDNLDNTIKYFSENGISRIGLYGMHIHIGMTDINIDSIPKYTSVVEGIKNISSDYGAFLSVHWMPLCISIKAGEDILIREVTRRFMFNFGSNGKKLFDGHIHEKTKLESCKKCYAYGKFCFGVYKKYLEKFGDNEFHSLEENRVIKLIKRNNIIEKNQNN